MRLSAQPTTGLHQKAAGSPASPPEPMSLASGEWFIHANGSYDICGDWQHSGSWAGSRQLGSDPDAPHYYITIYGRLRSGSFGRVPYMWSAKLVLGDMWITIPTTHPSCKSVADACHQADRALTQAQQTAVYTHRRAKDETHKAGSIHYHRAGRQNRSGSVRSFSSPGLWSTQPGSTHYG